MFRGSFSQPAIMASEQKSRCMSQLWEAPKRKSLTREVWIVKLYIPQAVIIQDLQLVLIRRGDVGEVLIITRIHILRIRFALFIPQMIPIRRRERQLQILHFTLRDKTL